MSNTAVLEKILNVREKEKEDAQVKKVKAVEYFEKLATQLYHELKTKEKAEANLGNAIKSNTTITIIKEQSHYISIVNRKINTLQHNVQQARVEMDAKQAELTEAYVEVKKIEKLIESREKEQKEFSQKQEMLLMDEISIRQYQKQTQNR